MAQSVIWTDDTPIRTLAPGTGKTRLSRFWCYAVDPRPYQGPGCPAVLYRYSPDRKRQRYRKSCVRDLACWCAPKPCPGDVLIKLANREDWCRY